MFQLEHHAKKVGRLLKDIEISFALSNVGKPQNLQSFYHIILENFGIPMFICYYRGKFLNFYKAEIKPF